RGNPTKLIFQSEALSPTLRVAQTPPTIIDSSLDDFGMADRNLNSLSQLLCEPRLALLRQHIRRQHRNASAFSPRNSRQPTRDIQLPVVHGIRMSAAAA